MTTETETPETAEEPVEEVELDRNPINVGDVFKAMGGGDLTVIVEDLEDETATGSKNYKAVRVKTSRQAICWTTKDKLRNSRLYKRVGKREAKRIKEEAEA